MEKTLDKFKIGESGRVLALSCEGALRRRIIDMGITPGTEIILKGKAPFGDPIQINLRGYFLSIRKSDAKNILLSI